jgi:hypothetical protein
MADAAPEVMRTHHTAYYVALAIGAVLTIGFATASGLWIDAHLPLGSRGVLAFLGATAAIVLAVELFAGMFGDWIDDLREGRAAIRREPPGAKLAR